MIAPVFKKDVNLDFNISKTKVLDKESSVDHLFEHTKHFLDTDPDLPDIPKHFTRGSSTTEGIEVLGTPVGNDRFIQTFVGQNCLKIMGDIGKHDCFSDGLVNTQLLKYCQNTHTQFISANINIPDSDVVITAQHKHVDRKIT
jgi:hypothetical protein